MIHQAQKIQVEDPDHVLQSESYFQEAGRGLCCP